jgi:hypothetical protein
MALAKAQTLEWLLAEQAMVAQEMLDHVFEPIWQSLFLINHPS